MRGAPSAFNWATRPVFSDWEGEASGNGGCGVPPLRNERAKMGHDRLGNAALKGRSCTLLDFFHGQERSVVVAGRVDGAGFDSGKGFAKFGEL